MPIEYALTTQFMAFVALYFVDSRAAIRGWAPPWYGIYRFLLTAVVGLAILVSLVGRAKISTHGRLSSQGLSSSMSNPGLADHDTDWAKLEAEERARMQKEKEEAEKRAKKEAAARKKAEKKGGKGAGERDSKGEGSGTKAGDGRQDDKEDNQTDGEEGGENEDYGNQKQDEKGNSQSDDKASDVSKSRGRDDKGKDDEDK